MDEMVDLSILGGERVELVDVEFAELFDVDGTAVTVLTMVELRVVLVDVALFGVVVAVAARPSEVRAKDGVEARMGERVREGVSMWAIDGVVEGGRGSAWTGEKEKGGKDDGSNQTNTVKRDNERAPVSSRPNPFDSTHAAISSVPNSLLHFSLASHMIFVLTKSNFLALKNRRRVLSSYLS